MMTANSITVATAADDSYALPLSVMLRSLSAHLQSEALAEVFVLSRGLAKHTLRQLEDACSGSTVTLRFVTVEDSRISDLKLSHHFSISTYYRLLLEDLLPHTHKLIYLDADLIVCDSLTTLWDIDLGGALLGAVRHASKLSATFAAPRGVPSYERLGIPGSLATFNAGVMIIDLDKWREFNVSQRVFAYLRAYRELVLWLDQDGLNVILQNQWKQLPAHWNVMTSHFAMFTKWQDSMLSKADFDRALNAPSIIHFSSEDKPWLQGYSGPFLDIFEEYAVHFRQNLSFSSHVA